MLDLTGAVPPLVVPEGVLVPGVLVLVAPELVVVPSDDDAGDTAVAFCNSAAVGTVAGNS